MGEALGVLDDMNLDQIALLEQKCLEEQAINLTTTAETCDAIMGYFETISDRVLTYNARIFDYDWNPKEEVVVKLFTNSTMSKQTLQLLCGFQYVVRSLDMLDNVAERNLGLLQR